MLVCLPMTDGIHLKIIACWETALSSYWPFKMTSKAQHLCFQVQRGIGNISAMRVRTWLDKIGWRKKCKYIYIVMSCNGILIIITDWLIFGYFIWEEFWGFADLHLSSLDASAERDLEGGLDRRQVSSDFCSIINNVNSVCALLIMLIYLLVSLMMTPKGQDRWVIHQCVCVFVCFQSISTHSYSSASIL